MKEVLDNLFENFEFSPLLEEVSLNGAREYVQEALATGEMIDCPCCGRNIKKYQWSILRSMLTALNYLNTHERVEGKTLAKISGGGVYAKLKYWGLTDQTESKNRGYWFITPRGRDFLHGYIRVPKHAYVFNTQVLYFSNDTVCIDDIKKNFDLAEIMGD